MKLPKYELGLNNEAEHSELSDSSFLDNARSLVAGYRRFLPSLAAHQVGLGHAGPEELLAYNEQVAKILYGPRILDLFKQGQYKEIEALAKVSTDRLVEPQKHLLGGIDLSELAMLLVRPEARFLTDDIKRFLREQEYEIVLEHPLVVDLKKYWAMYNPGFMKSALEDFPTRTLVYTHGESKIMILHKEQAGLQDHLVDELKGEAGVPSEKPTLRGTVVLSGLEAAKAQDEEIFYNSIDPLGMYRAITSGKIRSVDPYGECADPVLYYAGQGVHIPDGHELATNMGGLLKEEQLKELSVRYRKVRVF